MTTPENPYAGQGAVLLDIGGDVGALIVAMPPSCEGLEVEIRPKGATSTGAVQHHHHQHDGSHHDDHDQHDQHHEHHEHHQGSPDPPYPHVAVVGRPAGDRTAYTLVYPNVTEGSYELFPLPDGPVVLTAQVTGGAVAHAVWPGAVTTE